MRRWGGLYAYVMLQAHEMTQNKRFPMEAQRAVQALTDLEFDLEYQFNITAWGACACLRLWKATGLEFYRDEGYVLLAGFFHNTMIWESKIGAARHYSIFMGRPVCTTDLTWRCMNAGRRLPHSMST